MNKTQLFNTLITKIEKASKEYDNMERFYGEVVKLLNQNLSYYNWTGFYFIDNGVLKLGHYIGRPTEHVKIKIGEGICGRAVSEDNTILVGDVTKEKNYLACSIDTKSEIVVPIRVNSSIIGEIDIDSDKINAFDEEDKIFLEKVVDIISKKIENT